MSLDTSVTKGALGGKVHGDEEEVVALEGHVVGDAGAHVFPEGVGEPGHTLLSSRGVVIGQALETMMGNQKSAMWWLNICGEGGHVVLSYLVISQ